MNVVLSAATPAAGSSSPQLARLHTSGGVIDIRGVSDVSDGIG
jgi:hypothetical protein